MLESRVSTSAGIGWDRRLDSIWSRQWFFGTALLGFDLLVWILIYSGLVRLLGSGATTSLAWSTAGLAGLICTLSAVYVIAGYSPRTDMLSLIFAAEYVLAILTAVGISFVLVYALTSYSQNIKPSRGVLLLTFATAPFLGLGWRRAIATWHRTQSKSREFLVIGGGERAQSFYRSFKNSRLTQGLRFVSENPSDELDGVGSPAVFGDPLHAVRRLGGRIAGIIIADDARNISPELTTELVRVHFEQVPVYTLESFYEHFWQKVPVMALDASWPLQKGFPLSTETPYNGIKRLFDVFLAFFAFILLLPLMLVIATLIRAESVGPVIFRQERMGWHRRSFSVFKFRTMFLRTEEGSLYTEANDRRITRVGHWLRKFRLDELPQLWNVLIGDMSLIGPRAEWIKCVALYEDYIPSYHFRHLVRPGITGWAQVNYPYGSNLEDAIQKLKYDLYYIRNYSLKLDAMIVLKTIHVVFMAKGT